MKICLGLVRLRRWSNMESNISCSRHRPLNLIRRRRRYYCRLKILSDWRVLALFFYLSFLSVCPLLFSFLSLSVPLFSTPEAQSAEPAAGRRGEVAGAQRKRWRGLRVLRAELSSRCRQGPQLRAYISEAGAGTRPPALPYTLSGSSQARLPPTGSILGRTRPSV